MKIQIPLSLLFLSCHSAERLDILDKKLDQLEEELEDLQDERREPRPKKKQSSLFNTLLVDNNDAPPYSSLKPPVEKKVQQNTQEANCNAAIQNMINTIDHIFDQIDSDSSSAEAVLNGTSDKFHKLGYAMGVECGPLNKENQSFAEVIIHISNTMGARSAFSQELAEGMLSGMCGIDNSKDSKIQLTREATLICSRY